MTWDEIFTAYYTLYRAESQIPDSTDDEYTIALALAKEAISYWENYDATYWKELFTTAQTNGTGAVLTLVAGTSTYAAPTAMREAGGFIKVRNLSGTTVSNLPIMDPQEAQFRNENAKFVYFTGNPSQGFTLHFNKAPNTSEAGFTIDYVYYKKATAFTTGTDKTEMANPFFIVHRMLAQRFRASRNPYYSTALRDAENAVKVMQMDNNSGTWANPWTVPDRSGTVWGAESAGNSWSF